ncbi:hypothetical protein EVAR_81600_1 [Eumeta japonica]|uniref:Uncharacterized protein n=1 Tax=Eumeta variegata TaxID=151549 RepID=A0A4C1WDT4_EUMVA|nr:hypothetical protein EVAR_81600_1 [Eumeta japonica]
MQRGDRISTNKKIGYKKTPPRCRPRARPGPERQTDFIKAIFVREPPARERRRYWTAAICGPPALARPRAPPPRPRPNF